MQLWNENKVIQVIIAYFRLYFFKVTLNSSASGLEEKKKKIKKCFSTIKNISLNDYLILFFDQNSNNILLLISYLLLFPNSSLLILYL